MSSIAAETRQKILEASVELLKDGTVSSVRMSDIARRAGISRQALYLHFSTRTDLLVATTFFVDEQQGSEARLARSRSAKSGIERLDAYIAAWAAYIPDFYPIGRAIISMRETDKEADAAWRQRMDDMKEGCEAAISALASDGNLSPAFSVPDATDLLWSILQVENWRRLTEDCGWSQAKYAKQMQATARQLFVEA